MRRSTPRAPALFAALVSALGCVSEPTEVMVQLGTNVPLDVPLTIQVAVRAGVTDIADDRRDHAWPRGPGDGGITLPGSFAVVPPHDGPRDGAVTLLVEGVTPRGVIRRLARFAFTPRTPSVIRVFLATECLAAATGCATAGVPCTRQQLCEEAHATCGNAGECVDVQLHPDPLGADAGADDVVRRDALADVRADAPRDAPTDVPRDVPTDVPRDVPTDTAPACGGAGRACCAGSACDPGLVCASATCVACGAGAQPCCAGGACGAGYACVLGTCACGLTGGPCCGGTNCLPGSVCQGGSCAACGALGQPCCGASCNAGGVCSSGSCVACGAQGQPCCGGGGCDAGVVCVLGTCVCGLDGTPCCGGSGCLSGNCQGGTCAACIGVAGRCGGGGCCSPYVCGSTSLGTVCCGNRDAPCSASNQCCGSQWCCDIGGGVHRCRNGGTCG